MRKISKRSQFAGRLLAVTGNERHCHPLLQQGGLPDRFRFELGFLDQIGDEREDGNIFQATTRLVFEREAGTVLEGFMMLSTKNLFGPEYASFDDSAFIPKYQAACFCGCVRYEVSAEPVDAKLCHCRACQTLHGAPLQWAAIFHKHHVRVTAGLDHLRFFNGMQNMNDHILPCKVSCSQCGTPIADEGRRMWLAFPPLFDFGQGTEMPDSFKPTCHIFYGQRVLDFYDNLPKWSGHKNNSVRL